MEDYQPGNKNIPFEVVKEFNGSQLEGIRYEQLIPWVNPVKMLLLLYQVICYHRGRDRIVHIAPTFGADDFKVARHIISLRFW
jgi:isoleucyl-tRNA synthetase